MESVERAVTLPASPDEAWQLVRDLGAWFGPDVEGEVAPGGVVRVGGRRAIVERMDEPERLTFRWLDDDPSRVDITLEPDGDETIVHIEETRIEPAVTPKQEIGFKALART
jgi:hypothetical protein